MKTRLPVTIALLLAACGDAGTTNADATGATAANAAPAKQTQKGAPPATAPDFSGKWEGQFDGGTGTATITKQSAPGRYGVDLSVIGDGGCSGAVGGDAIMNGGRLVLSEPVPEGRGMCRIIMIPRGGGLSVSSDNCFYFHGMSCGFVGELARRNAPVARPAAASGNGTSWLVGAWAPQGSYCASGDPVIYERDGGYRNSGGDIEGRWSLAGAKLTIVYAETDPTTGEASGPKQRSVVTLTRVNATEIKMNQDRLRRCPASGGAEPWHPGERFDTQ